MVTDPAPPPNESPGASAVSVLVIDDQPAVREGVARLISCAGIPVRDIRMAASAAEALLAMRQRQAEIVVLDVDLAGDDGLALLPHLVPDASVLVLTSHGDRATRDRAMDLGARAFVEKHRPAAELLSGVAELVRRHRKGQTSWGAGDNCPAADDASSVARRPGPE